MSSYTILKTNLVFNRETFNYKYEVESAIEDEERIRQGAVNDLHTYATMTEPEKFIKVPEDGDMLFEIQNRINECVETIQGSSVRIFKLETLLEEWDKCHNEDGLAIPPSDEEFYKSYLSGDFVNTVESEKDTETE